jgi:hypothetical protein
MSNLLHLPQFKTTRLDVAAGIDDSTTTGIKLEDVTGIDTTKPGLIAINYTVPVDLDRIEYIEYTSIDGAQNLVGVTRGAEGIVAKAHSDKATIAFIISKSHINRLNDRVSPEHNADGTHSDITADSVTAPLADFTNSIKFNAPEGFLINGKIVPTVASNNLTVALKTLNDEDPSATNPVYVRIGGVVRSITSALVSATASAGTNWLNMGSAELATREVDLFVYLVWDTAGSVMKIGWSRIPYANLISEFASVGTQEKAIIGNAVFTATDTAVNVGRFAATLSAGAGYTWSVPTFTPTNLIQRPIFETRDLGWAPTYSASGSMTWGSITTTRARYKIVGNRCFVVLFALGTTGGSASNELRATLPMAAVTGSNVERGGGSVVDAAGISAMWIVNGSTLTHFKYDSSNWGLSTSRGVTSSLNYQI